MSPLLPAILLISALPLFAALRTGGETELAPGGATTFGSHADFSMASNGELSLVVWQEERRPGSYDIIASRVDRNGRILDQLILGAGPDREITPHAVWDGQRFFVVWSTLTQQMHAVTIDVDGTVSPTMHLGNGLAADVAVNRGRALIVVARYPDLLLISRDGVVRGTLAHFVVHPRVAPLGDGFLATWFQLDEGEKNWVATAVRLDLDGTRVSPFFTLGSIPTDHAIWNMAEVVEGGDAIVAIASKELLRLFRVHAAGGFSEIGAPQPGEWNYAMDIAARDDGGFDAVWYRGGRVVVDRFLASGAFSHTTVIAVDEHNPLESRAEEMGGRTFVVHRRTLNNGAGTWKGALYGQFVDQEAIARFGPRAVNQQHVALAGEYAVWYEERDLAHAIMACRISDCRPVALYEGAIGAAFPAVAETSDGIIAVWRERRLLYEPLYSALVARRLGHNGTLGEPVVVTESAHPDTVPRIASDGTNALVVYTGGSFIHQNTASLITPGGVAPRIALPMQPSAVIWNGEHYVVAGYDEPRLRSAVVSAGGTVIASHEIAAPAVYSYGPPSLAWSGERFVAVYTRLDVLHARTLDRNGAPTGEELLVDAGPARTPRAAWDGVAFTVAWSRFTDRFFGFDDVFVRRMPAGEPLAVSATPVDEREPALAPPYIAYQRMNAEGIYRIYVRPIGDFPPRRRLVR